MNSSAFIDAEITFLKQQHEKALQALRETEIQNRESQRDAEELQRTCDELRSKYAELQRRSVGLDQELRCTEDERAVSRAAQVDLQEKSTSAVLADVSQLEQELAISTQDIQRLEFERAEGKRTHDTLRASQRQLEQDLLSKRTVLDSLTSELDTQMATLVEIRRNGQSRMESLEQDVKNKREEHTSLSARIVEKENDIRRVQRERAELASLLKKEQETVEMLHRLEGSNAHEKDAVLRSKHEMMGKLAAMKQKSENDAEVIGQIESDLAKARSDGDRVRASVTDAESRVVKLVEQFEKGKDDRSRKSAMHADLLKKLSESDTKRAELQAGISEHERVVSQELARDLRELARVNAGLTAQHTALVGDVSSKAKAAEEVEREVQLGRVQLNALNTENEFLVHKIAALTDEVKGRLETEEEKLGSELDGLKGRDRGEELKGLMEERSEVETEVLQVEAELKFLTENDMLLPDGRVRPVLVDPSMLSGGQRGMAVVDRLRVNEFLAQVQEGEEVDSVARGIVEKIAEVLAMIKETQKREETYKADVEKMGVVKALLEVKIARMRTEAEDMRMFRDGVLVQLAVNQLTTEGDRGGRVELVLGCMGLNDEDWRRIRTRLSENEKEKVEVLRLNGNELREVDLVEIVEEFVNLRRLDVSSNPQLESVNELERFLRNKAEGITSVFRDGKVIIANSGKQIRLTVTYAE